MSPDRKAQQPLVALPMLEVHASPKLARTPMESSSANSPQIAGVQDSNAANLPRRVLADNFDGPASHSSPKPGHARLASMSTGAGGTRGYVSSSRQAGVPQPRMEIRQPPMPAPAQAVGSASTGLPPLSTSGLHSAQAPLSPPILPPVVQKMFGAYNARDLEDAQQQQQERLDLALGLRSPPEMSSSPSTATESAKVHSALPELARPSITSAQAGPSSNTIRFGPAGPGARDELEDDDQLFISDSQRPRASVAPSLLHPSQSLAAARALMPAERDSDDEPGGTRTPKGALPPLAPPVPPKSAVRTQNTVTTAVRAPNTTAMSPKDAPTPPPRGKSKPGVARKPAPTYSDDKDRPHTPATSTTAANSRAGPTMRGQPAPPEPVPGRLDRNALDAPLLGADWLMPLRGSSSSALVPAPTAASELGAIASPKSSSSDEALGLIHQQSEFPPAVPAKDASVTTPLPSAHVQSMTLPQPSGSTRAPDISNAVTGLLGPDSRLLDTMTTSASPRSPGALSVDSYSYPLSLLSMKDDDSTFQSSPQPHLDPAGSMSGALRLSPSPLVKHASGHSSGQLEAVLSQDTVDMLSQMSFASSQDEDADADASGQQPHFINEVSRCSSGIASPANAVRQLQMSATEVPTREVHASRPDIDASAQHGGDRQPSPEPQTPATMPEAPDSRMNPSGAAQSRSSETEQLIRADLEHPTRFMPMSVEEARAKAMITADRLRQQRHHRGGSAGEQPPPASTRHVKKARSSGDLLNFATSSLPREEPIQSSSANQPTSHKHAATASESYIMQQQQQLLHDERQRSREEEFAATALAAKQEILLAAQRTELHHLRFLVSALAARLAAAEAHMGIALRDVLGDPRVDELIRRSAMQLHLGAGQAGPAGGVTSDGFFESLAKVINDANLPHDHMQSGTGARGAVSQQDSSPSAVPQEAGTISTDPGPASRRTLRSSASGSMLSQLQEQGSNGPIGEAWIALRRAKRARDLAADATRSRDTILTNTYTAQTNYPTAVQRSPSNASSISHLRASRAPSEDAFIYSTSRMGSMMSMHNRVGALLGRGDSNGSSAGSGSAWHSRTSSIVDSRLLSPVINGSAGLPSGLGASPSLTTISATTIPMSSAPALASLPANTVSGSASVTSSSVGTRSAWTSFSTQATSVEDAILGSGKSSTVSSLGRTTSLSRSASLGRSGSERARKGLPPSPSIITRMHHTDKSGVPSAPHRAEAGHLGLGIEATGTASSPTWTSDQTPSPSYAGTDGRFQFPPDKSAQEEGMLMPAISEHSEVMSASQVPKRT